MRALVWRGVSRARTGRKRAASDETGNRYAQPDRSDYQRNIERPIGLHVTAADHRVPRLWTAWLRLSRDQVNFARRGFHARNDTARRVLEAAGEAFIDGYNAALAQPKPAQLATVLDTHPAEYRGFAYEGAAMAIAVLDTLIPWRQRFAGFRDTVAVPHLYMVHVGAGWALARLRRRIEPFLAGCDPLFRWLIVDGYGFHEGYFHPERAVAAQRRPQHLSAAVARIFDQGLGRSLWFVCGADVDWLAPTVAQFPGERRGDLWSGIGLACTYAGGCDDEGVRALSAAAAPYQVYLAQGAAFAAKARARAGDVTAHTERACRLLCGVAAIEAAHVTNSALAGLPCDGKAETYEGWRTRTRELLMRELESY